MRRLLPAGLVLLGACVRHLPAALPPARLGVTDEIPLEPVSGSARAFHLFGYERFGDDTTEAALRDAKRKNPAGDDLINVAVTRRVICFPACDYALFSWAETDVEGTLVRYKGMPDLERPKREVPRELPVGRAPPAEPLVDRLMHLYLQDPAAAAEFYASLGAKTRGEVAEEILAARGRKADNGKAFTIPDSASPDERRFLSWFVATYTVYQPLDE